MGFTTTGGIHDRILKVALKCQCENSFTYFSVLLGIWKVPVDWRLTNVSIVKKAKNKDPSSSVNFTLVLGKIMENIFHYLSRDKGETDWPGFPRTPFKGQFSLFSSKKWVEDLNIRENLQVMQYWEELFTPLRVDRPCREIVTNWSAGQWSTIGNLTRASVRWPLRSLPNKDIAWFWRLDICTQ